MSDLDAKRTEIAALVAMELGLGDLALLSATDRAAIDQQTEETIASYGEGGVAGSHADEANLKLRQLLHDYRALEELRVDENDVRLAEEGEVFGREDDA